MNDTSDFLTPENLYQQLTEVFANTTSLSCYAREVLGAMLCGMLLGRTVNLVHLCSQLPGAALISSRYRRLQRFLSKHSSMDNDWLASSAQALAGIDPPWVLSIDRTNWRFGGCSINILVLCVAKRNKRIPLMWTLLAREGNSNTDQRIELLKRYLALYPVGTIKRFLGDREFIGGRWLAFLLESEIPFAMRLKDNEVVVLADGQCQKISEFIATQKGRGQLQRYPLQTLSLQEQSTQRMSIACKRIKPGEYLVVASEANQAKVALSCYRRRWSIECLFADIKKRGFNIEDTHIQCPKKHSLLLGILSLAVLWCYAASKEYLSGRSPTKNPKGEFRKSYFRHGFEALRQWLIHQPGRALELWQRMWKEAKIYRAVKLGVV